MMKLTKKLSALLVALVLALQLAVPASAATVTVSDSPLLTGHSFTAYQVFAGREESGVLSDVTWGSGIDPVAFLTALQADADFGELFAACTTAAETAEVLSGNSAEADLAETVAELAYAHRTGSGTALQAGSENALDDGYYLIVDTTDEGSNTTAYNKALLQVVGDIVIGLKTDAPSVEKKVGENTKYSDDAGYGLGFNDVADYAMGDAVPFLLIGTVPDMSAYDVYAYVFHDTYSAGLDAPQNVKVYLSADKTVDSADTDATAAFTFNGDADGRSFSLACEDLKAVAADSGAKYVLVSYTAVLNQSAAIGLEGNTNQVYLEYANDPNWAGEGDTQPTGETPIDKVIVFTYALDTSKVDGADNTVKLADAEFVLYRQDADGALYAIVDENGKLTDWTADKTAASVLVCDSEGMFRVAGLDDGTYYLEETKAPAGYNLLSQPLTLVISAETVNGQNWASFDAADALTGLAVTADNVAGSADLESGTVSICVANNKGAVLPETGGRGTTVLYVVGGLLVVGAAVLLITRKRTGDK